MLHTPFNPPPPTHAEILDALTDPTLSLRDIAKAQNTTTAELSAWLTRPEIADQLRTIDAAATARLRHIALNHLPAVLAASAHVLETFNAEERNLTPDPKTQAKRADPKTDCRARHNALRASSLILRLARLPAPGPRRAAPERDTGEFERPPSNTSRPARAAVHDTNHTAPTPRLTLADLEQLLAQLELPTAPQVPADAEVPQTPAQSAPAQPSPDLPSGAAIGSLPSEILPSLSTASAVPPTIRPPRPAPAQSKIANPKSKIPTLLASAGLASGP